MYRQTIRNLIMMLSGSLISCLASAEPIVQSLTPLPMQVVSSEQAQAQSAQLEALVSAVRPVAQLPAFPSGKKGHASLQPLYSSQSGSWPFESFVHAGLFKVIASFQTTHPRMLHISGGHLTLTQVQAQLGDSQALRPHKDGYLLNYPLMVAPDASLSIENTTLYLNAHSGAAIINQGRLQLLNARVESFSGDRNQGRAYRPFIMAWAGSQTRIIDSQLSRLGYNAHLARGLSAARSAQQPASVPAARLLIQGSQFEQLSAVQLQDVDARIEDSSFQHMQLYALDAENSRLQLRGVKIENVRNHSGIRLRGNSQALLQDSTVRLTGKAALELSAGSGIILAERNRLSQSGTSTVQLRDMAPGALLVLRDNQLAKAGLNLVDAQGPGRLLLRGNRLEDANHAINLQNGVQALILENSFSRVEQSALKSERAKQILIGANVFDAKVILQKLFGGELLPIQSAIVEATISRACHLQIGGASEQPAQPDALCQTLR